MKRFLIILGLITLSTNLFSIEVKQNSESTTSQEKLSKWDKIKVTGALLGSALFTYAALLNPSIQEAKSYQYARGRRISYDFQNVLYMPSLIAQEPFKIYNSLVKEKLDSNTRYLLSTAYLSILAFILASYATKKLINQNKQIEKLEIEDNANQTSQKQQLKNRDNFKILGSSLGCVFFAIASLLNSEVKNLDHNERQNDFSYQHIPSRIILYPFGLIYGLLNKDQQDNFFNFGFNITTAISSMAAYKLGSYAISNIYKRFVESGNKKENTLEGTK